MLQDNSPRHICFFSGKRGGFNHMVPIFEAIQRDQSLRYSLVVADMHLSPRFGRTIGEVERWASNVYQIETLFSSDSKTARAKSIGVGLLGIADLLPRLNPDMVFILGDRGEVISMAVAALEMNIPIVHLFGGDITKGGVDEVVRHALSKFASLHLASNQDSANRIIQMGEESWRVHCVGSPVLDLVRRGRYSSPQDVASKFGLDLSRPIIILLQHSVTWQVETAREQINFTIQALDRLGHQTIAVYPCSDPGYEEIVNALEGHRDRSYFQLYPNIDFPDFWGLMHAAGGAGGVLIGNSSAGIMEATSFRLPVVNIGIRQEGRMRASNVLDVDHDPDEIEAAVNKALYDSSFRRVVDLCVSPYGDGESAERIVQILKNVPLDDRLIQKQLTW